MCKAAGRFGYDHKEAQRRLLCIHDRMSYDETPQMTGVAPVKPGICLAKAILVKKNTLRQVILIERVAQHRLWHISVRRGNQFQVATRFLGEASTLRVSCVSGQVRSVQCLVLGAIAVPVGHARCRS